MKSEMCCPLQVELAESSKDKSAKLIIELIREDGDLRRAILDVVLSCPNVVSKM